MNQRIAPPRQSNPSSEAAVVAVVDTGVDAAAFAEGVVLPGICFDDSDRGGGGGVDPHGHGTKMAHEIVDFGKPVRILPVRLLNHRGALWSARSVNQALDWLLQWIESAPLHGVCLAFSDGGHWRADEHPHGDDLIVRVRSLRDRGVAVVAAAGNWYREQSQWHAEGMGWPAVVPGMLSAGALAPGTPLRLDRCSQRLRYDPETGRGTTAFLWPGEGGETSAAAARLCAVMAWLGAQAPTRSVDERVRALHGRTRPAEGKGADHWPAFCMSEDAEPALCALRSQSSH